ncbi:hypothetical protein B0T17DRAFT_503701 [Bombardia bombarda]|uniref:Uncharacterized protein n=1 Tax=Bombardia bombarda TaxID=252184 RepID=A0AA39XNF2_9PEZI|nr:hypothetical protein B0T17DRAFT_503701 [Bombardia bombarda]
MKAAVLSSLLFGLAAASPLAVNKRQDLPIEDYGAAVAAGADSSDGPPVGDAVPESAATYDPTSVAADIVAQVSDAAPADATSAELISADIKKRVAVCTTRTFNGPQVTAPADTPEAFQANTAFSDAAVAGASAASVPAGYAVVPGYENLKAAAQDPSYLTYVSSKLTSYSPAQCGALCDALSGCSSFTIFYERVPLVVSSTTQVPDKDSCPGLTTSPSATLIKCAFYGMPLIASTATNVGQFQGKFKVVYAGVTAFTKSSAPSVDGYEGPVSFGNASINAPAPVIDHGYLRVQTFGTNVPYDPSLCAASCAAQTTYNANHGTFNGQACIFFNAYILYKNGENGVFTCAYYGTPYGVAYAKNKGQFDAAGNKFTIGSSFGYYLDGHYVAK